jgi:tellurite methyltransferase
MSDFRLIIDGDDDFDVHMKRFVSLSDKCDDVYMIDLRSADAFERGHVRNSTNLPFETLFDFAQQEHVDSRGCELPPKGTGLWLLHDNKEQLTRVASELDQWRYSLRSAFLVDRSGASDSLVERGNRSRRCWKPSAMLTKHIDLIESKVATAHGDCCALDLACGSGRDCVFLALRQASREWRAVGVELLDRRLCVLNALADRWHVGDRVRGVALDLESSDDDLVRRVVEPLRAAASDSRGYALVNVARYLHRPLLPMIAERLVAPGGIVAYHTFMDGCQHTELGRPRNPKFLLADGELARVFAAAGDFVVHVDEVIRDEYDRPLSIFIAQRRRLEN